MLVSLEWLRDFVDFDLSTAELADKLTMAGLEVENIISAPKLSLCVVDVGDGKELSVVCGAPNARVGLLSPLALEGAVLPNGVKLKAAKIRGEVSHGMLCSEQELKIGEDAGGIMELPPDLEPGMPIIDALGLDNEILELELTPNRSDCLSILGVAREVSAMTGNPLRKPKISFE